MLGCIFVERSVNNAMPMMSHKSFSAGNLLVRIVAAPVACNASSSHSGSMNFTNLVRSGLSPPRIRSRAALKLTVNLRNKIALS